jgi:hypothetical protein
MVGFQDPIVASMRMPGGAFMDERSRARLGQDAGSDLMDSSHRSIVINHFQVQRPRSATRARQARTWTRGAWPCWEGLAFTTCSLIACAETSMHFLRPIVAPKNPRQDPYKPG